MQEEGAKALGTPDLKASWAAQGAEPTQKYAAFVKAETAKWGKLARDAKVTVD